MAGREEILYAACDPGAIIAARRVLDTDGHYDRPDLDRAPAGPSGADRPGLTGRAVGRRVGRPDPLPGAPS